MPDHEPHAASGWATPVAVALCLGIGASRPWPDLMGWVVLAAAGLAVALVTAGMRWGRPWRMACLMAIVGLAAAWHTVRTETLSAATLSAYLTDDGALGQVEGRVVAGPYLTEGTEGPFAAFGYESPATLFGLRVESVRLGEHEQPVRGQLIVRIDEADPRLKTGQRIRARGWLSALSPQKNPGDFDYKSYVADRGIVGRLGLAHPGNWQLLDEPGPAQSLWGQASWIARLRAALARRAAWSLGLGMAEDPKTLGLLQSLLLGETREDIDTLRERFREVGLAHILSISGAHLAILVGLVWMAVRLVVSSPPRAALVLLAVLVFYLLAIPLQVPVVRAAIMAGLYFGGVATGRRLGATTLLSLAAIVVLIWRPQDLFNAGAQLSFITVWALLKFVRPVSRWLWPDPLLEVSHPGSLDMRQLLMRRLADCAAVSIVAAVTTVPLVAWHFKMVNPLAVLLSIVSLPLITAVLGVGYLKVFVGLLLPSASLLLSGPLRWLGAMLTWLVEQAATWPGSTLWLMHRPPGWWVGAAIGVGWACMGGWFRGRTRAGAAAVLIVAVYAVWWERPIAGAWLRGEAVAEEQTAAATLTMLAVGDGSCYVLRSGGQTLVFDCGSQPYPLIGRRTVVPALRTMGVDRVDVLVISHADLDHYNGSLDLVDAMEVRELWVSPQVVEDAAAHPKRATAYLLSELRRRGLLPRVVTRGERAALGDAALEVLWPPPWHQGLANTPEAEGNAGARKSNDWSVVLSVKVAGRRLLLNGDIQQEAIGALLRSGDELKADVTDLPHHGSFVDASVPWLDAVRPRVVLQSSGPYRLRHDRWAEPLAARPGITRFVTDRDGMVHLNVNPDGTLTWRTFLKAGATSGDDSMKRRD